MLILDTETTGLDGDAICWQAGFILASVNISRRTIRVISEKEITLAYRPEELPERYFNGRLMFEAFQPIRDEAFEFAREEMGGIYDPPEFRGYMINFIIADREEKAAIIADVISKCDVWTSWNLRFDKRVLQKFLEEHYNRLDDTVNSFCLLDLYRKQYPGRRNRLVDACSAFGISVDATRTHTALYDAQLTLRVLQYIFAENSNIFRSIGRVT